MEVLAERSLRGRRKINFVILVSCLSALLACALMALSALHFQPSNGAQYLKEATAFMLLGMVSLWVSLWLSQRAATGTPDRGEPPMHPSLDVARPISTNRLNIAHRIALVLGIFALVSVAIISSSSLASPLFAGVSHHLQFALFVAGIVLVTWGLGAGRIRGNAAVAQPSPDQRRTDPAAASALFQRAYPDSLAGGLPASGVESSNRRDGHRARSDFWLILPILLLAFAVRFWELGDAVHHFVDEIHFSTAIANFWLAPDYNVPLLAPFGSITAFPWLFPYLQASAVGIFGRDLEGLRALSAVLGTLTVPALYLLAKMLFDRKTALIAALLLATFPPHVNFSRIGLNNIADPLFGTLALAFLARGLKVHQRMDFAIGGAALGLSQYFYEGGRFLFIFLLCLWLIGFILIGQRNRFRTPITPVGPRHAVAAPSIQSPAFPPSLPEFGEGARGRRSTRGTKRDTPAPPRVREGGRGEGLNQQLGRDVRTGIITFVFAAVLVAAPVYYVLYALQRPLAARMDIVGVGGSYWLRAVTSGGGQTFDQHLLMPFLTYVFMPEQALYYDGDHPMILEIFVPIFLLGAAYALWRWRGPGMVLLLWVLLTSAGNSLMTYAAIYARYVVVFPALPLLMALGLRSVVPLVLPSRINMRFGTVLMVIITVVIAAVQTGYYFGPHLELYNQRLRSRADEEDALFRSVPFPPGTRIHLVTGQPLDAAYVYGVLGYLADHLSVGIITPDQVTPDYLLGLSRRIDHAFYVEPKDMLTPQTLAQYFSLQPPAYSPFNVPQDRQYILYYIAGLSSPGS
jgi:hypothetical protein